MKLIRSLTKTVQQFQLMSYLEYSCNDQTGKENPKTSRKSYETLNYLKYQIQAQIERLSERSRILGCCCIYFDLTVVSQRCIDNSIFVEFKNLFKYAIHVVFLKLAALKNFEMIITKYLCWSLSLKTRAVNLVLMNQVMEFCDIDYIQTVGEF